LTTASLVQRAFFSESRFLYPFRLTVLHVKNRFQAVDCARMKGLFLTAAAALLGSALADGHQHRRAHEALHHRRGLETAAGTCGCVTKVITYLGSPTRESSF
jgi:hypothetical protein